MLQRAAAAHAEVRAARRHALRRGFEDLDELGFVVALVEAAPPEPDAFARQRAGDEHDFAAGLAGAHHAFGFVREIGDHAGFDAGMAFACRLAHVSGVQAARNSSKCGCLASVSQVRVRASSSARPASVSRPRMCWKRRKMSQVLMTSVSQ